MQRINAEIIHAAAKQNVAEHLREQLTAQWNAQQPPATALTFSTLDAEQLIARDAFSDDQPMIILTDGFALSSPTGQQLISAIGRAENPTIGIGPAACPLLGLLSHAGALTTTSDQSPHTICHLLLGLLHRQPQIDRLKLEAEIAQRCSGGLQGQMSRIHDELQLAAMVQRDFLPRTLPACSGFEVDVLWRPSNYVSGDIYDIRQLDDDHIGIFLADAVGHGMPAALMTMAISRSLQSCRELASTQPQPPSEVLTLLNGEMIQRRGQATRFITAVYAIINCRERMMRLAGAGHPPPLLVRNDGSTAMLETSGGLLGVFENETYTEIDVELDAADQVLLYTDGFEQAFPDSSSGDDRLNLPTTRYLEVFQQVAGLPSPREAVEHVAMLLDQQRGSLHQNDDLTLICMHAGQHAAHHQPHASQPVASGCTAAAAAQSG